MQKFFNWLLLWTMRKSEVSRVDGIILSDVSWNGAPDLFRNTIQCSLRLIQVHDARRYERVKRTVTWIVNKVNNALCAGYDCRHRTINIDFNAYARAAPDQDTLEAGCACIIVSCATGGLIALRGLEDQTNRVRIDRLCHTEMNRFAAKLAAFDGERYRIDLLHVEYRQSDYERELNANPLSKNLSYIRRVVRSMRAEPVAAPSGGPAASAAKSGVTDGPPSVT